MIGKNYFHSGITLKHGYAGNGENGWSASASFHDAGFCNDNPELGNIATEGFLSTRYSIRDSHNVSGILVSAKALLDDLTNMGITTSSDIGNVFYIDIEEGCFAPEHDMALLEDFAHEIGYRVILGK